LTAESIAGPPGGTQDVRPMSRPLAASLVLLFTAACSSSASSPDPCTGVSGACVGFSSSTSTAQIVATLAQAASDTTYAFAPGTYAFGSNIEILITATAGKNLTIQGAGSGQTILDFKSSTSGNPGLNVTGTLPPPPADPPAGSTPDAFTLRGLTLRDPPQVDGFKAKDVDGLHVDDVSVYWTTPDPTAATVGTSTHGGYGLYPVESRHVLIERSFTSGATDTGIYVGQSQDIVVRNSEATGNVAGIEIENSYRAQVYGNHSHDNAGGILVFSLPGLKQPDCHDVSVFQNLITSNNHENFAPEAGIVSIVPPGTALVVMAAHDVEIRDNQVSGNRSDVFSAISYFLTGLDPGTGPYDPFPRRVSFHDNTVSNNAWDPWTTPPPGAPGLGDVLAGIQALYSLPAIPDHIWDGVPDPAVLAGDPTNPNPQAVCIGASSSFLNLGTGMSASGPTFSPTFTTTGFGCSNPTPVPPSGIAGL